MKHTTTPKKFRKFKTFSLFCGFGGEAYGKQLAFKELGIYDQCTFWALNHWKLAVDTFQQNCPHALTFCEDIKQIDAAQIGCGDIDLLWASPSCTHHSNARGGKPKDDQQRSHPFDVFERWIAKTDVRVFMMENVWEIIGWGPLLEEDYIERREIKNRKTGKIRIVKKTYEKGTPDPRRKGEYFEKFIHLLQDAGYTVEWRKLNAADYGDPTTRKRFFLIAVKDGMGIQWPTPTHRDPSIPLEKLTLEQMALPLWKSAADHVIDWSIPGRSIYYRTTGKGKPDPLADDTIRRIKHGLKKFGLKDYFEYRRSRPSLLIDFEPFFESYHGGLDAANRIFGTDNTLPTLDCSNRFGLVRSFISKSYGPRCTCPSSSIGLPLPAITTWDHNHLCTPSINVMYGQSNSVSAFLPLSTVTANPHHQLMRPCIIQNYGFQTDRGTGGMPVDIPFPTICTSQHHSLIRPIILRSDNTSSAPQARLLDQPVSTVVSKACHHNDYVHSGPRRVESLFQPISTLTTKRGHTLCEPCVIERYPDRIGKGTGALSIHRAFPTIVGSRMHQLLNSYFVEYYGSSHSQSIWTPLPTVTTKGRHGLIDLVIQHEGSVENLPVVRCEEDIDNHDFTKPFCIEVEGERFLVDVTLRMLEPRELARAMGFPDSFRLDHVSRKKVKGVWRERIEPLPKGAATKMIGNACPVNTVKALIKTIMETRLVTQKKKRRKSNC